MTCPHCQNSDLTMLEWTGKLYKFMRVWVCLQCSREFAEFTAPPPPKPDQKV